MENWEFLLQKQGDKSWLPLESPSVEILEGQYRLASRTNLANALISIQLDYTPHPESIHRPNQQKVAKRVNSEGLLIVMPYTHFTPGTWQIACIELEDQVQAQFPRSVCVQLEVQPISAELINDWQVTPISSLDDQIDLQEQGLDDNFPPSETESISEPDSVATEAITTQQPEQGADEFNSLEPNLEQPSESNTLAKINQLTAESEETKGVTAKLSELPYNLIALNQSQYLISEAQALIVAGKSYLPGELEIVLKNPQDLATLQQARFSLATSGELNEPIHFDFELDIPVQTSQVMVGEVRLHPSIDVASLDGQAHIYYQAIAITYQSPDILAEVAEEITAASQPTAPRQSERFDASPATSATTQVDDERNSPNLKLPQLPLESNPDRHASPELEKKFARSAKLPELPRINSLPRSPSQSVQSDRELDQSMNELFSDPNDEMPEEIQTNLEESTIGAESPYGFEDVERDEVDNPPADRLTDQLNDQPIDRLTDNLADQPTEPPLKGREAKPKATLPFSQTGDRFLDKLQALSKESINTSLINQQVSEFIEAEVEKLESEIDKSLGLEDLDNEFEQILIADRLLSVQGDEQEPVSEAESITEPILVSTDVEQEAEIEETVASLADEVTAATAPTILEITENAIPEGEFSQAVPEVQPTASEQESTIQESAISEALNEVLAANEIISSSTETIPTNWPTLAADESVPVPVLEIPIGEAIAGIPLPILIKLPAIDSKLFVKLWVKDCQTRNIIDGPRWLVDFHRDSDADFMTLRTPITLPLGTMEVAFEAIAIEMQTQRESRKISTIRTVSPPNLAQDNDLDFDPP